MKKGDTIFFIFPKNCKGTHVGVMLSFAIFVIFLAFLYSILNPSVKIQRDKSFLLDNLQLELMANSSGEMDTFTILIDEGDIDANKDCINFPNVLRDIIGEVDLIIKDENEQILNYKYQGNSLYIYTGVGFSGFLKIYYSEELDSPPLFTGVGCHPIPGVSLGIIKTDTEIFESNIFDLFTRYEIEYEVLKEEYNIPEGTEFGFSFTFSNGTIVSTGEEIPLTSVYAKEVPAQYIDEEGNLNFGYITIRVW